MPCDAAARQGPVARVRACLGRLAGASKHSDLIRHASSDTASFALFLNRLAPPNHA